MPDKPPELSNFPDGHPIHGLTETMRSSVQHLNGSWQYQIFNNLDEACQLLQESLSPQELQKFKEALEILVKKPLRRQMGRIKNISRTVDEFRRYLS